MYTHQQDIQVHNNRKQNNKFDNSRQFQIQMKLKLRYHVVASGSSHWVQEGVDEVVYWPIVWLWSWACDTKKIESCVIIEILAWIQNTSLIYLWVVDVWDPWIAQCGGMRKWRRQTVRSVPLLQGVISYTVKQYCLKIGEIAYNTLILRKKIKLTTLMHFT
jgi:hypothetical protein